MAGLLTAAVVLDHLVRRVVRASAHDVGLLTRHVVLDSDGVLADIFEPHKLEVAGAVTVNAFGLVLANDDVTERCA